jgi:hypothetical protein
VVGDAERRPGPGAAGSRVCDVIVH